MVTSGFNSHKLWNTIYGKYYQREMCHQLMKYKLLWLLIPWNSSKVLRDHRNMFTWSYRFVKFFVIAVVGGWFLQIRYFSYFQLKPLVSSLCFCSVFPTYILGATGLTTKHLLIFSQGTTDFGNKFNKIDLCELWSHSVCV